MNGFKPKPQPDKALVQTKKDPSSSRTLVLIGIAAAFCATFAPHMIKLKVASKLADTNRPVASPPHWVPVFLASIPHTTASPHATRVAHDRGRAPPRLAALLAPQPAPARV